MTTQANMALMPVVSVVNNQVTALSTDVARFFGKRHDAVIRDIKNLCSILPSDRLHNFVETVVTRENPSGGAPIKSKAYRMTRDGFTLLVMGWTGERALQFKLAWLDAFNRMEEQLRKQQIFAEQDNSLITNEQQYELSSRVIDLEVLTLAISEAMRHTVLGFDSPKTKAQGAKQTDGAIFMRNSFSLGEADGASSDAPIPLSRSVNPSTSPARLTAGCECYNLTKDTIMQTNVGNLQPVRINLNDLSLRVFNINNEPWFAVTDICSGLKLTNPSKVVLKLRDCERSNLKLEDGKTLNIVNESGLYTLILRCDAALKEGTPAFNFRVKVTDEILPSIRKRGYYAIQGHDDNSLITPEQQYEISSHVMRKTHALFGQRNYSAVYQALKRRFRIPRYTCLLNRDYETALKFIDSLTKGDFNLPDVPEKSKPSTHGFIKVPVNPVSRYRYAINSSSFTFNVSRLTTTEKDLTVVSDVSFLPERKIEISAGELRAIKVLVYFFEDLFKPFIQWAEQEARRQHHPRASAFYDVWNEPDLFMCALKRIIKRNS